jgi:hypothetical protein
LRRPRRASGGEAVDKEALGDKDRLLTLMNELF